MLSAIKINTSHHGLLTLKLYHKHVIIIAWINYILMDQLF